MVQKAKNTNRNAPAERRNNLRSLRRGFWLLCGIALVGVLSWFLLRECSDFLFRRNPRFALKQIEVESTGYWGRDAETRRQLRNMVQSMLTGGSENGEPTTVYSKPLAAIRSYLEQIPSIESATIERRLPGTLKVKLVERIPRAFINSPDSQLVVSDDGRIMDSRFCQFDAVALPVIETGRSWTVQDQRISDLKQVLHLLTVARNSFWDIDIVRVTQYDPEQDDPHARRKVEFLMVFRGNRRAPYYVKMWLGNDEANLALLQGACETALRTAEPKRVVNMIYENRVTFQ